MPSFQLPPLSSEPDPGPARDLKNALEAQAEAWLAGYTAKLGARSTSLDEKVVNDAVWGSVRLYPWEVAVLDSPLMQRLRGIRQLGVIHWVYPNAGHSRFEHSLGVMHAVQELLDGIERNSGGLGRAVVDTDTAALMRLAGLVHDCGHAVMSHVTEPVLNELPGADDLRYWLRDLYSPRDRPSVSEAFAAVFVRSPAFIRLLGLPAVGADFLRDPEEGCAAIAGLLLGSPVFPDKAFLSLVINGPFDADKLDYIQRDAQMAGVPCALDVSRLVEKVHVVSVPPGYREDWDDHREWARVGDDEPLRVLAIPRSATSVLDELAIGRATLSQKVYFHQKVRAIEAQVRQVVRKMDLDVAGWLELSDDSLLQGDGAEARQLRERDFLKRALHFKPPADEEEERDGFQWRPLSQALRNESRRRAIDAEILEESVRAAELLGLPVDVLRERPPAIDVPPVKDLDQAAFLGTSYRDLGRVRAAISGQRSEIGKLLARQQGYVHGPSECLIAVFFGAAKVLAKKYKYTASEASYSKTKIEPAELHRALRVLRDQKFFEGHDPLSELEGDLDSEERSQQAKLVERFLRVATSRILRLAENLGRYQSPDGVSVTPATIADFLRQFETVERVRVALRLIENLDFKDRAFFVEALATCLAQIDSTDGTYVCPLGSSGDSSAMLSYLMGDLEHGEQREVTQLEIALDRPDLQRIVMWDDFCGRGGHTITALAQWLDEEEKVSDSILKERLAYPLDEKRKTKLRETPISLAFAVATEEGLDRVRKALDALDLGAIEVLDPSELLPTTDGLAGDEAVFASEAEQKDFYEFMNARARDVHRPKTERMDDPWPEKRVDERLRGYGNTAARIVFFYNVPTMTLTLLWDGVEGERPWRPLLRRRGKPRTSTTERKS